MTAGPALPGGGARTEALVVVDMQEDFCRVGAPLFVAGAPAIVTSVVRAVELARESGMPVVWVVREHDPSGLDIELVREGHFRDGPGVLVAGSEGARLIGELRPAPGEPFVRKQRWSGFFNTSLDAVLRRLGVRGIVLAGVQTPNCIRCTAFDGIALGYEVTVLADATASASPAVQEANLRDLQAIGVRTPAIAAWLPERERVSGR